MPHGSPAPVPTNPCCPMYNLEGSNRLEDKIDKLVAQVGRVETTVAEVKRTTDIYLGNGKVGILPAKIELIESTVEEHKIFIAEHQTELKTKKQIKITWASAVQSVLIPLAVAIIGVVGALLASGKVK